MVCFLKRRKKMSHPDPLYDDHDDFYGADWNAVEEDNIVEDNYNDGWDDDDYYASDAMDGDHDSAMESAGWGTDEDYGYYGEDY
jgi:hypothetical protein